MRHGVHTAGEAHEWPAARRSCQLAPVSAESAVIARWWRLGSSSSEFREGWLRMHRKFRELLATANGRSEFVVAANLDIRGFSDWSRLVESSQTILYLTKVYPKLIDEYFADSWFFKPTGDGLLLVRPFVESELAALVNETVENSFRIVEAFATFCQDEPMVNFPVPGAVGIGLALGAASRLVSHEANTELTLDYSGRVLNLASRLMELARPRGVVLEGGLGKILCASHLEERLTAARGYIRGVSPDDEIKILYDADLTTIPESFSKRPGDVEWHSNGTTLTLEELEEYGMAHLFYLDAKPSDVSLIRCTFQHNAVTSSGHKSGKKVVKGSFAHEYFEDAGKPVVRVDFPALAPQLRATGVKGPWSITVRVDYPVNA
jgi:class 3 adenylate cyclase